MTKVTETLPQFSSELKSVKVINILVVIFAVFVLLGLIPFQFVRLDLTGLLVYVFLHDHDCLLLLLPYCSLKDENVTGFWRWSQKIEHGAY